MTTQPPQDEVEEVARALEQVDWLDPKVMARAAIATLDRLRSAAPAGEWSFDMGAAPRDGTPVALYAPTRREPFQCGFWIWKSDDNDDPLHGVWWLGDGRYEDQPVAWMPLPTPPKDETHG